MNNFIIAGLALTTPILLAAIGDLYAEKSGVLNLGIEASMILGAYFSYHFAFFFGNVYIGLLAAVIASLILGIISGIFIVSLKCDQVVYGVGINILALGLTSTIFRKSFSVGSGYEKSPGLPKLDAQFIKDIPFIGGILSQQTILFYVAIAFLLVTIIVLYYTSVGLKIRAAGDNPNAADTLGVNVPLLRYICLMISVIFGALGGAALTIGDLHFFQDGMTAGRGFIALAAIIFGRYKPLGVLFAALVFGMSDAFQLKMQVIGLNIPYQLFLIIPYLITILALFVVGPSVAPRFNGKPFYRGGDNS
ncbi:MAG: ABC transporter permease [Clostridia bacterium]